MGEGPLRALVLTSQANRWNDLDHNVRYSMNKTWSMACEGTVTELLASIRLVGAVDPGHVPWTLLAGGVYAVVLDLAGVPYDQDVWLAWEDRMRSHGGTVRECLLAFGGTVGAIRGYADELVANATTWETDFEGVEG